MLETGDIPESPELRDRLRSLSIPRNQRPGAGASVRRRGPLTWLLVIVVLGLVGYVAWDKTGHRLPLQFPATAPAAVRTVRVTSTPPAASGTPVLTATGKIVSDHQVEVATKVSGQIVAMYFEQGDRVEHGQVLAEIESVLPRARLDEARANLERARANAAYQEVNFTRVSRLFEAGQGSDIELADARRARDEGRAQVESLVAMVQYTEKIVRDCRVEAPISGVILQRNVEVGDFVAAEGGRGAMANSQFASIADMNQLRVEVDVNELDIARLYQDMPCIITPDAQKNRHYDGFVMWIDPGANYAKATIQVKVRIGNPDENLRVEGAAQVQFLSERPASAPAVASGPVGASSPATASSTSSASASAGVWIPATAVVPDASGQRGQVFVVAGGRLAARRVNLGRRAGSLVEVTAGLTEGQEIAAEGLDRLRDGQSIGG